MKPAQIIAYYWRYRCRKDNKKSMEDPARRPFFVGQLTANDSAQSNQDGSLKRRTRTLVLVPGISVFTIV